MRGIPNEIALRLRALRQRRGVGVRELARAAGCSPALIAKVEGGLRYPSADYIRAVAAGLGLTRREGANLLALLQLYEIEHHPVASEPGAMARQQRAIGQLLQNARVIRSFDAMVLPGPLQTEDYARAVFEKGAPDASWQKALKTRLAWRKLLHDPGKEWRFIIHENALRFLVCGPIVMKRQIDHLRLLSKLVSIRLIPAEAELPVIPPSDFTVLDDSVVIVDTLTGMMTFGRPEHVAEHVELFGAIEQKAIARQKKGHLF